MTIVIQLITALLGSLGFALLFNMPRRHLAIASFGGLLVWGIYLAVTALGANIFFANLIAAAAGLIWSEVLARIIKAPTTLYYITAFIPLIPGSSLYRTLEGAVSGNWSELRHYGMTTLSVTFGIAAGISLVSTMVFFIEKTHRKK